MQEIYRNAFYVLLEKMDTTTGEVTIYLNKIKEGKVERPLGYLLGTNALSTKVRYNAK